MARMTLSISYSLYSFFRSNAYANWIKKSLAEGTVNPNDYLPRKGELAFHIGVSIGTIQNAYRRIEDLGLVFSRQKIGTCICDKQNLSTEKLTSKRDVVCEQIKQYIKENNYKTGDKIVSTRKLAAIIGVPSSTIRTAINRLVFENILIKKTNTFIINTVNFDTKQNQTMTMVDKIAERINKYIKQNLKIGDKLPSSYALADMYNVSVKTIHDAIKILTLAGIVKTRRGYYGTVVSSSDTEVSLYFYEQVQLKIQKYISENCKINDKLPSIKDFSEIFNVSSKTIKKALDNLAIDGYVTLIRGRFGGTFVTEIPIIEGQGYTWLALSSEYETIN